MMDSGALHLYRTLRLAEYELISLVCPLTGYFRVDEWLASLLQPAFQPFPFTEMKTSKGITNRKEGHKSFFQQKLLEAAKEKSDWLKTVHTSLSEAFTPYRKGGMETKCTRTILLQNLPGNWMHK